MKHTVIAVCWIRLALKKRVARISCAWQQEAAARRHVTSRLGRASCVAPEGGIAMPGLLRLDCFGYCLTQISVVLQNARNLSIHCSQEAALQGLDYCGWDIGHVKECHYANAEHEEAYGVELPIARRRL